MNLFSGNYKIFLVAPVALAIAFIFFLTIWPGITPGIDLKGGTALIVRHDKPIDQVQLKGLLEEKFELQELKVISTGAGTTYIQFAKNNVISQAQSDWQAAYDILPSNPEQAKQLSSSVLQTLQPYVQRTPPAGLDTESLVEFARIALADAREEFQGRLQSTIASEFDLGEQLKIQKKDIDPALGELFWDSALKVGIVAIVLIIIVIFAFFREVVPSLAVIASGLFDMLGAMAGMALLGVPLGLASIPALLMLIGYSIDTDILLTTRILKNREGSARERANGSLKTGLTMTITTIGAVSVMLTLSWFAQMLIIFEIAVVLLFGLLTDLVGTWLMNAPILLWYAEKKASKVVY